MKANFRLVPSYSKNETFPHLDEKYFVIKKLSTGATSTVKLVRSIYNQTLFAAKIMKAKTNNLKTIKVNFNAEVNALKLVKHENIISMVDFNSKGILVKPNGEEKRVMYIILEYSSNGELFDYVYYIKKGFEEKIACFIFEKIINGVEACHKSLIAHRDLKTENIILDSFWNIKLLDFGFATLFNPGEKSNSFLGTISYVAPEILSRIPYLPEPVDIFSCGVVLFILITGKFPFMKASANDYHFKHIYNNDFKSFWLSITPKIPPISEEVKSLISWLFAMDPLTRPSTQTIKNHPWMNQTKATEEEVIFEFEKRKSEITKFKAIEIANSENENNKITNKELRVREFSENDINPYKVRICTDNLYNILIHIDKHFNKDEKTKKILHHPNSAKITIQYDSCRDLSEAINDLMFEIEVKKCSDKEDAWFLEFYRLKGDKKEFSEIFDKFLNNVENTTSNTKIC